MLDNIFLQVLNMSYTASYVILFILLARMALKKAPKNFSYGLWSVALFRLVCPWSFESALSLLALGGRTTKELRPFSQQYLTLETAGNNNSIPKGETTVFSRISEGAPEPLLQNIFALFWLIGIGVLLIYGVATLFRLKKHLRKAAHETENIYVSKTLGTPFVMGVVSPKIYLPESLSGTEKQYILLHEQIHIRRFDHVIKLVSFLVLSIHWFNPLVWLAFFLSGRDMEMSCDEAVIKKLGNDVKKGYSTSLLSLSTGRHIVGGTPLAFGLGDTKGRIINVLSYKKPSFWMVAAGITVVIAIFVGLAVNPKTIGGSDNTERLWQHRTPYIGNNSALGNILSILHFPDALVYEGFELYTGEPPYGITVKFKTDTQTRNYYTGALREAPFQINACILFSLIENAEYIIFSLDDGVYQTYSMQYTADWAESIVGVDLWEESKTLEKFEELLDRINDHVNSDIMPAENETSVQQNNLTFWVKPDESAQVIGETAAIIWLKSHMEESISSVERIEDYEIHEVTVISGNPKEGQKRQDMKYHYVVHMNYDIKTSEEYFAPGDGVSGEGLLEDLFRELYVKDLGGGNFEIVSNFSFFK